MVCRPRHWWRPCRRPWRCHERPDPPRTAARRQPRSAAAPPTAPRAHAHPPLGRIHRADPGEPVGRQQHVVVARHGAGNQRGAPTLHGDVGAGLQTDLQHSGDLGGRTRTHQGAGPTAVAAGVVDAAGGEHSGVGAHMLGADHRPQPLRQRDAHLAGLSQRRGAQRTLLAISSTPLPFQRNFTTLSSPSRPVEYVSATVSPVHCAVSMPVKPYVSGTPRG